MTSYDYYKWCYGYVSNIPLFNSVYNRPQVVGEQCSPTTLESVFEFVMTLYFNLNI